MSGEEIGRPDAAGAEREGRLPTPRIYVASLSDYNAGELHGAWLSADHPAEVLQQGINEMLARSPQISRGEVPEEWAIHDYEGFGRLHLSEYESLGRVSRIARGIVEHGSAFAAWADVSDGSYEQLDRFLDGFIGQFDSRSAWGDQLAEDYDLERRLDEALPDFLRSFVRIDTEAAVRGLEAGGGLTIVEAEEGGVYVFDTTA